jgi:hypothetical protein
MSGIQKLKAVRAVVRPDKRGDYLERWKTYAGAAKGAGAQVGDGGKVGGSVSGGGRETCVCASGRG